MGKSTGINWTNHTFNPWWGCTKVSPGCDNCYADTFAARPIHSLGNGAVGALDVWGKGKARRVFDDRHWNEPRAWNKAAAKEGKRHLVFCASMADVMDDEAPEGARERLWKLIDETPWLIWQLLTKRPQRYLRYLPKQFAHTNVWLGMTAENQEMFDVRADHLIEASVDHGTLAWISYEPALGPLTLETRPNWIPDWIIFGGESGPGFRPMREIWATQLLSECAYKGIPFFMKQMAAPTPIAGKKLIPVLLNVQQFPHAATIPHTSTVTG